MTAGGFVIIVTNNPLDGESPHGVGGELWTCNPRVSGSILSTSNLKKLFDWMKIHGFPQKSY